MHKTVMVATAALIGSFGVAAAADLGGGPPPSAYTEPAFFQSWQGFYIGGSVGYASADFSNNGDTDTGEDVLYTGRFGYNFQRGNLVLGAELTINGADNLNGETNNGLVEDELNWYATAVGRLGYARGPWLFYGFGGFAWGEIKVTDAAGNHDNSDNYGWTAGAGVERKLSEAISARLEYSHVDLDSDSVLGGAFDVDSQIDAVTLGVSYKFGPRGGGVPLK